MRRTHRRFLLTLTRGGHVFQIVFDSASCPRLLDYLIDLAQDRDNPLTWQDIFQTIDAVGAVFGRSMTPPSRQRV